MLDMIRAQKAQLEKRGKKGFTLMEMLIVIAIIAVLVAIAIPVFSGQLEKAREATDMANIRAKYAVISADLLSDPKANDTANGVTYSGTTYTATVDATQTQAGWQTAGDDGTENIGGINVTAKTSGSSWTITGDTSTGTITIS